MAFIGPEESMQSQNCNCVTHLLSSVIRLCKLGRLDKPWRTWFNSYVSNPMQMPWTDRILKRRKTKEEESTATCIPSRSLTKIDRDSADALGNEYQRLHHSDGPLSRSGDHRCDKAVCCVTFTRSGKGTIHIIAAGWSMILNIIRLSESKYCHIIRDFFEILHPERGLREPQTGLTPGEPPSWSWLTPTPGKYEQPVQESVLMCDCYSNRFDRGQPSQWKNAKCLQQPVFPGGHPSKY